MRLLCASLTLALTTAIAAGPARADDHFDSKGWTLLGERAIDGARDHDVIQIGRAEGVFTAVTLVAADGDFDLDRFTITFGNKDRFAPEVRHAFRDGTRSRLIDLPGKARGIESIELGYSKVVRGRPVKVQVWGKEGAAAGGAVVTPEPPWDQVGWSVLGSARASGKRGTVTIRLRGKVRDFERLTFAVNDGDLQITDVDVVYARGPRARNRWNQEFREGARRMELALAGAHRPIKSLRVKYVNRTPTRRATIQVWGKDLTPETGATFDAAGWTKLGEQIVDGKRDRDTIKVNRPDTTFTKMAIVVVDSDLSLDDLSVTFGNKEVFSPQLRQVFDQGTRSRVIDFPANQRFVDHVDLKYSNLPGGGRARIQVWAK